MARRWTNEEIVRARKMLAAGISRYEIDRYFGRPRNSTWQKLATLDDPAYRCRQIEAKRDWRRRAESTRP